MMIHDEHVSAMWKQCLNLIKQKWVSSARVISNDVRDDWTFNLDGNFDADSGRKEDFMGPSLWLIYFYDSLENVLVASNVMGDFLLGYALGPCLDRDQ